MQSGLSRELFESWCTDKKNTCIVAGYCVEGTLAKQILSEPEEITTMNGTKLPMKMQVHVISFSAHTDYKQTSGFIRELKPPHCVLGMYLCTQKYALKIYDKFTLEILAVFGTIQLVPDRVFPQSY